MLSFLNEWDDAIDWALENNEPAYIYKQDHMLAEPKLVARTMHPSFMGKTPPKHDPNRDQ